MTEWNAKLPGSWRHEVSSMAVGDVREMSMQDIKKAMMSFPGQFVWAEPGLLKRVADEDNGHRLLSVIYRHPDGITLGVLINRFKRYSAEAVTEMAAKLEASGHVRSVSSVHKYNKRQTITYYPA